jgi:hypothetical protein
MNKPKHTPGPWYFDEKSSDTKLNIYRVKDENALGVALICGDASDAILIAAAPELLEACIAMDKYTHAPDSSERNSAYEREQIWAMVRVAIAKATGGAK